ncbi:hypothetical protein CPC08DRAFT_768123, partial [Agrocybe pediades]
MKSQSFTFSIEDASWREHTASQADDDTPAPPPATIPAGSMLLGPLLLEPPSVDDQDTPMAGPSVSRVIPYSPPNPLSRPAQDDGLATGSNPKRVAVPGPSRGDFDIMRESRDASRKKAIVRAEQLRTLKDQRKEDIKRRDEEVKRRDEELMRRDEEVKRRDEELKIREEELK